MVFNANCWLNMVTRVLFFIVLLTPALAEAGQWSASFGVAIHDESQAYREPTPLGLLELRYQQDKAEMFIMHISSIPGTKDNDGGLNMLGMRYRFDFNRNKSSK